jgi:hypothetical protein
MRARRFKRGIGYPALLAPRHLRRVLLKATESIPRLWQTIEDDIKAGSPSQTANVRTPEMEFAFGRVLRPR